MMIFKLGFILATCIPIWLKLAMIQPYGIASWVFFALMFVGLVLTLGFYPVYHTLGRFVCPVDQIEVLPVRWETLLLNLSVPFLAVSGVPDAVVGVIAIILITLYSDEYVLFDIPLRILGFRFYRFNRGGIWRTLISRTRFIPVEGIHSEHIKCVNISNYLFLEI